MVDSLKSFALQHPHLTMKIVVGITLLAIALLVDPATAMTKSCEDSLCKE